MTTSLPPGSGHSGLALTGERTLPGIPDERYWFERHVAAYLWAARAAHGAVVLDAGCGEGYGLRILAGAGAARAIGVDLDAAVVEHAARAYGGDRIEVLQAELTDLPLASASVDLAVSLQVIEHVWDPPAFLGSLRRVLRPEGRLVLCTPNRLTFTPGSETPVNPFHVKEYAPDELADEVAAAGFAVVEMQGVHHGWRLRAAEVLLGRRLPDVLGDGPPDAWPTAVRWLVHRTTADWFAVRPGGLEGSLDLLVACRVP